MQDPKFAPPELNGVKLTLKDHAKSSDRYGLYDPEIQLGEEIPKNYRIRGMKPRTNTLKIFTDGSKMMYGVMVNG